MKAIVGVVRWLISVLFLLRRRMGVRHRTCFFSHQASRLTPDFALLQQQLRKADPTMDIVTICCRYRGRQDGLLRFCGSACGAFSWLPRPRYVCWTVTGPPSACSGIKGICG